MKTAIVLSLALLVLSLRTSAQYKLYQDGLAKYNEKEYTESIRLLSEFLARPQHEKKFDVEVYYYRGIAAFKLNSFLDAAGDLEMAKKLNHNNRGNIHWFLAQCYNQLQRYQESLLEYDNALRELQADKTKQSKILGERALVYITLGNKPSATQDLQTASALDPANTEYKNLLAGISDSKIGPALLVIDKGKQETKPQTAKDSRTTEPISAKKEPVVAIQKKEEELKPVSVPVAPPQPTLADLYGDEKRFALVIGNSDYSKKIGVLKNPVNDATSIKAALEAMNFQVTLIPNATYAKIKKEMLIFRDKLNSGEKDKTVGLFFYAGHGLQYDNENYIVPVDAELEDETDITRMCWPIQKQVLGFMENTNSRMNIVILDACRNNPFPAIHRGIGESNGLGEMKKARGAFIAYATSPGSVASDGSGKNGLYTQELIKAMSKPGKTIEQVFKEVRGNVLRQSGDKQNPWENSNIVGDFYFKF